MSLTTSRSRASDQPFWCSVRIQAGRQIGGGLITFSHLSDQLLGDISTANYYVLDVTSDRARGNVAPESGSDLVVTRNSAGEQIYVSVDVSGLFVPSRYYVAQTTTNGKSGPETTPEQSYYPTVQLCTTWVQLRIGASAASSTLVASALNVFAASSAGNNGSPYQVTPVTPRGISRQLLSSSVTPLGSQRRLYVFMSVDFGIPTFRGSRTANQSPSMNLTARARAEEAEPFG